MECHTLNMVNGTRIFSPFDIDAFMSVIGTARSMAHFAFFWPPGYGIGREFRSAESRYVRSRLSVIHFKANKDWDRNGGIKTATSIFVCDVDFIHLFLSVGRPMNTKQEEVTKYMKFWAGKLNMNPVGVGTMALRENPVCLAVDDVPEV
jgi:hypothetical protein